MNRYSTTLFLFTRDLRLDDNNAFLKACEQSKRVIPCFIFEQQQVGSRNTYRSLNAIQFMIESLQELANTLTHANGKLYIFTGKTCSILKQIILEHKIDAIFLNYDYTPFAMIRYKNIKMLCDKLHIACITEHDYMLNTPETILKKNGLPYSIFTPYFKKASQHAVAKPTVCTSTNFFNGNIHNAQSKNIFTSIIPHYNKNIAQKGGRSHGVAILKHLTNFNTYTKTRDFPSLATTKLSAHIKFGTVSIREVYWAMLKQLGNSAHQGLIRQLYWHDFYYQIAFHWPHVFGSAFHTKYNKIKWRNNKKEFKAWCQGNTGFPIVDAGMHELNQTGYMHNRVRMIVASFLTKDLLIDWRWGERYFAQQLVDYDPCVNNGNWQWAASTGCDPQPYFRIFNPWLQQKKFDPQCIYIKQWVKELKNVDQKIIHTWDKQTKINIDYPRPIADHTKQKQHALKMFKQ